MALQLGGYQNPGLAKLLWIVFAFAIVHWFVRHEVTRRNIERAKTFTQRTSKMHSFIVFLLVGSGVGAVGGIVTWLVFATREPKTEKPKAEVPAVRSQQTQASGTVTPPSGQYTSGSGIVTPAANQEKPRTGPLHVQGTGVVTPPPKLGRDRLKQKIRKLSHDIAEFLKQREQERPSSGAEQAEYDRETGRKYHEIFKSHAAYIVQIMRISGESIADDFYCGERGETPPTPYQIRKCVDYLDNVVKLIVDRDWDDQVKELKREVPALCRDLIEFNQEFTRQESAIESRFVHTEDTASMLQGRVARMNVHEAPYLAQYSPKVLTYRARLLGALYIFDKELINEQPPDAIAANRVTSVEDVPAVVRYLERLLKLLS